MGIWGSRVGSEGEWWIVGRRGEEGERRGTRKGEGDERTYRVR